VLKFDAEQELMERLGLDVDCPETSCCGMAGAFGFERGEKYDVAMACGERRLLPSVRQAADDTLVIADGFSCQEQIGQGAGRRAYHLAEVLQMSLHRGRRPHPPLEADTHALSADRRQAAQSSARRSG
jgi:Fe-S oxidoreductase